MPGTIVIMLDENVKLVINPVAKRIRGKFKFRFDG